MEMADMGTPFIHNAWYVIATSAEVGRVPMARTALGQSIVLYRTEAGAPVALQNRCCHRSFPLAHGKVEGDTIVCGYHGLRFDCTGQCIEIPMQRTVPASVKVRAYCTIERGSFVWIWMGKAAEADPALPPHQPWMDHPDWDTGSGYLHVKGSYVHLHENLLDLSHLSFLHSRTFGTPEYARAPVETKIEGNDIQVWRHVECHLPPIYAEPLGWTGARARRSSGSQYVAPGLHVNTGMFRNLERAEEESSAAPTVKVAQLITPETNGSTHYWYVLARNFARHDPAVTAFMMEQQLAAFSEDVFALERICEMLRLEPEQHIQQISLPTDRAGVLMRRHLRYLADLEH
jgi:phenylpropionate dioxygenase-like ring-hydroxylating dioxygenase large terminal subunit